MERLRLHQHFKGSMGEELAATMMESLPPAGWGDLATKHDLELLQLATKKDIDHSREITDLKLEHWAEKFDLKLERMEERIMGRMERGFKLQTFALITAMSLVGTAARLF